MFLLLLLLLLVAVNIITSSTKGWLCRFIQYHRGKLDFKNVKNEEINYAHNKTKEDQRKKRIVGEVG